MNRSNDPHRCAIHDLGAGPDGRCVLCRREQAVAASSGASGPGTGGSGGIWATAGILVLGMATIAVLGQRALRATTMTTAEAAAAPPVDDGTPPADLADATQRVRVTVYSTSWCPHCQRAKAWLKSGGHPFVELDVERDNAARQAHRRLSRSGGVPVIEVDGSVLQGFDAAATGEAIQRAAAKRLAAR